MVRSHDHKDSCCGGQGLELWNLCRLMIISWQLLTISWAVHYSSVVDYMPADCSSAVVDNLSAVNPWDVDSLDEDSLAVA